jgi:hypothetical protein
MHIPRMKTPALSIIVATASLSGCYPYATTYVHLDAEHMKRTNEICRWYGAPANAIYEANGVRFEFNLDPSKANYYKTPGFNIVAAPNVALSMPDDRVRVSFEDGAEPSFARVESKSVKREANGLLTVETWYPGNRRYRFELIGLPPLSSRGTIEMPAIYANGVALPLPKFTFERRGFVGILPINC